MRAKIVEI